MLTNLLGTYLYVNVKQIMLLDAYIKINIVTPNHLSIYC